jgi:BolA protein
MNTRERIEQRLREAFEPSKLEVIDDSHLHAGHIGHPGSGHPGEMQAKETHFTVKLVSRSFLGKARLQRHRMVNEVLADELRGGVHALAIMARAPDE